MKKWLTASIVAATFGLTALITSAARCADDAGQLPPTEQATVPEHLATPAALATPGPYRPDSIASSVEEAASFTREIIFDVYPIREVQSLEYVETTVGQVRDLFGPPSTGLLNDPGAQVDSLRAEDDWTVWAFRGRGTFQSFYIGFATQPPPLNAAWVLVLQDRNGVAWFGTEDDYELSQLGSVGHVLLPLDWGPVRVERPTPAPVETMAPPLEEAATPPPN